MDPLLPIEVDISGTTTYERGDDIHVVIKTKAGASCEMNVKWPDGNLADEDAPGCGQPGPLRATRSRSHRRPPSVWARSRGRSGMVAGPAPRPSSTRCSPTSPSGGGSPPAGQGETTLAATWRAVGTALSASIARPIPSLMLGGVLRQRQADAVRQAAQPLADPLGDRVVGAGHAETGRAPRR